MAVVAVAAGSDLDGATVADAAGIVVAVRSDGGVDAIPDRSRTLAAGDTVYAVVRPDAARRLEATAAAPTTTDAP
jgi:Trk K+ transport system NAD-binding subunit